MNLDFSNTSLYSDYQMRDESSQKSRGDIQNANIVASDNKSNVSNQNELLLNSEKANQYIMNEKALADANIVCNEKTLKMVESMMGRGMNISTESVQDMYRNILNYQDTDVLNLVDMKYLQIPINGDNIETYTSLINNQAMFQEGMGQITDLLLEGNGSARFQTMNLSANQTIGANIATGLAIELSAMFEADNSVINGQAMSGVQSEIANLVTELQNQILDLQGNEQVKAPISWEELLQGRGANLGNEQTVGELEVGNGQENQMRLLSGEQQTQTWNTIKDMLASLSADSTSDVSNLLNKIVTKLDEALSDNSALKNDPFARNLQTQITEGFERLFHKKDTKDLIKNEFLDQFKIDMTKIKDGEGLKEAVKNQYDSLQEITKSILQNSKEDTPVFKVATQTNQSLQMLNQINLTYQFVQMPIKFIDYETNGKLQVYTNKKNLGSEDGTYRAFLHLDMASLGPVDIHVELKEKNVATNFVLESDEILSFIEKNMEILDKKLEEKGYQVSSKVSKVPKMESKKEAEVKNNSFHKIKLKDDKLIYNKSFDFFA